MALVAGLAGSACGADDAASGGVGGASSATTTATTTTTSSATGSTTSTGAGVVGGSPSGCEVVALSTPQAITLPSGCTGNGCTSVGFTPLSDLVGGTFSGVRGGLYCDSNVPPVAYANAGAAVASSIVPRDGSGMPDPNGKLALVGIGMSHTTMEFSRFIQKYGDDASLSPSLVLVDGALGGHATPQWIDPDNEVWTNLTARLANAGVTDQQVVATWVKLARQTPQEQCDEAGVTGPCFGAHEALLADEIRTILGMLKARFPNLGLVYLASRSYAGYASSDLNPEPYAYGSAFAVKKLVMEKILELPEASDLPWLAWGPYLWADGTSARSDGLTWVRDDFVDDGTHPTAQGRTKVADMLFDFFSHDPSATPWFLGP